MMNRIVSVFLISIFMLTHSGCAAIMALNQPKKKDLQVLSAGVSRDNVITFMGVPTKTEMIDGRKVDTFSFKQGYSGGVRASRATMHIIFDLFTLFIWELIGMPIEALNRGAKMVVQVTYDESDLVKDSIVTVQK